MALWREVKEWLGLRRDGPEAPEDQKRAMPEADNDFLRSFPSSLLARIAGTAELYLEPRGQDLTIYLKICADARPEEIAELEVELIAPKRRGMPCATGHARRCGEGVWSIVLVPVLELDVAFLRRRVLDGWELISHISLRSQGDTMMIPDPTFTVTGLTPRARGT